ncbi:hypothetical protein QTN93_02090 [Sphingomonas aerolata]|uniref:hypothetical protein n=1 Tax=Sphingomonas aerolata TaxID=185951 RepID=UPI0035A6D86F
MAATVSDGADDRHADMRDALMIEAFWAAGDYDAIDWMATAIQASVDRTDAPTGANDRGASTLANWWLTGAVA